jgi:hypothetical protein
MIEVDNNNGRQVIAARAGIEAALNPDKTYRAFERGANLE